MAARDNIRLSWRINNQGENLDAFQQRMETICENRRDTKPYEQKMFDEGWMFIEWTRFKPFWNKKAKIKTAIGNMLYNALQTGEKTFDFDKDNRNWSGADLVSGVKEITLQLSPKMALFLSTYRGQHLLLDRRADQEHPGNPTSDWELDGGDITWFLKRSRY